MAESDKLKFLVVDPNVHMRTIFKTVLFSFGFKGVFEASNEAEAETALDERDIDILVISHSVPNVDAVKFTTALRRRETGPYRFVPVIMAISEANRSFITAARDSGVTEIIGKPIAPKAFFDRIVSIIERPRQFVRTEHYVGPDRRRQNPKGFNGPYRRAIDFNAVPNG
jgi:two-component system, chemotaxis family, chemotaxis protein CheY